MDEIEKAKQFRALIQKQKELAAEVKAKAFPVDPQLEGLKSFQEDAPELHASFALSKETPDI